PGDRSDEDIIETGRLCGSRLDMIYVKEDSDLRGRCPGQVAGLLVQGIKSSGSRPQVKVINDELEALKAAINSHLPGDLIAMFYENIEPVQQYIKILGSQ
ncbi:MAG TPA: cyanophycin synthetase, partial [Firmicutes bacterium]|nr:cyanophycin synthetase [Bacillota bacterium]